MVADSGSNILNKYVLISGKQNKRKQNRLLFVLRGEVSTIPSPTHSFNTYVEHLLGVTHWCGCWDRVKNQTHGVLAVTDFTVGGRKETHNQLSTEAIRKLGSAMCKKWSGVLSWRMIVHQLAGKLKWHLKVKKESDMWRWGKQDSKCRLPGWSEEP